MSDPDRPDGLPNKKAPGQSSKSPGSGQRRVGDATQRRIDNLADGWTLPTSETRKRTPLPPPPSRGQSPATVRPPLPAKPAPRVEARSSAGMNTVSGELDVGGDLELPERTPQPRPQAATPPPRVPRAGPRPPKVPNPILPAHTPTPRVQARPAKPPEIIAASSIREQDATELMIDLPAGLRSDRGDATELQTEMAAPSVVGLASAPKLPRKRGIFGDVRYVFTVMTGVAQARGELSEVRERLDEEHGQRDDQILHLAREAVADPVLDLAIIREARDTLADLEERRARDAGVVAGAEAEMQSIIQTRKSEVKDFDREMAELQKALENIEGKLGPLEERSAIGERKIEELRGTLKALDEQIERLKVRLESGTGDAAAIHAQLASVRAEREAVAQDEPSVSADYNVAKPQMARLVAERDEITAQIASAREREADAKSKAEMALKQLREQKKTKDRELLLADQKRNDALRAVGETLCIERPKRLASQMRGIDHHDAIIATLERRAMELEDLVRGIDKSKLARGILILIACASIPVAIVLALM